jgi:hypothetical protein
MAHSHILVGAGASVANPLSGNLQLTRWRSLWLSYISRGPATAWMSQSLRIRFACGGSALLRIALGPLDQFESGTRQVRASYMVFQQTTERHGPGLEQWTSYRSFRTDPRNEGNGIEVLASCSSGISRHHPPRLSYHLKART